MLIKKSEHKYIYHEDYELQAILNEIEVKYGVNFSQDYQKLGDT